MKILKPKFWLKKNLLSYLLLPISHFLQIISKIKNRLITHQKLDLPIICVGNIFLGGTGKTPLCIKLTEIIKKFDKQTAIVKKFYKAHKDEYDLIKSKKIRE